MDVGQSHVRRQGVYQMSRRERVIGTIVGILSILAVGVLLAEDRYPPQFKCTRGVYPHVQCEAKNVWPADPVWNVYYRDTNDIVDVEWGIVAYITLPQGFYSRFEMCLGGHHCLSAWGGWFGSRLLFRYEAPEECNPESGQRCLE